MWSHHKASDMNKGASQNMKTIHMYKQNYKINKANTSKGYKKYCHILIT